MKKLYSVLTFLFIVVISQAQPEGPWMYAPYLNINGAQDEWKQSNFYEIQKAFNAYEKDWERSHPIAVNLRADDYNKEEIENPVPGSLQFRRWEFFTEPKVYPTGDLNILQQQALQAYDEFKSEKREMESSVANWTSIGPINDNYSLSKPCMGRMAFLKVNPSNTNIFWAGAATGGLWKSTDAGATWNAIPIGTQFTSDLVFDPANSNIMFLATGDADGSTTPIGILKSTDGGNTWNPIGLTTGYSKFHRLLIHPSNSSILFVASNIGLAKTTNGGGNWIMDSRIGSQHAWDVQFKPGDPSVVYVSTQDSMYKSTDTGGNFNSVTTGIPTTPCRKCIGVSIANPSYVYLLCTANDLVGVYRSTDSGNNYSSINPPASTTMGGQGYYNAAIAICPTNANHIFACGTYLYQSPDGGATWNWLSPSGPDAHSDVHAINIFSPTLMFICSDGGIVRSTDDGASTNTISNGLIVSQLYNLSNSASNPTYMVDAEQDNGLKIRNTNGWKQVMQEDGTGSLIDYTNPDIMYFEQQRGKLKKTINGTSANPTITSLLSNSGSGPNGQGLWVTPLAMHPTDPNTILIGKQGIYRSTDGGSSWTPTAMPGTTGFISHISYAPSNGNYIYAGNSGTFFVSTDGNTFTNLSANVTWWGTLGGYAISSTNPQKIWMLSGPRVMYSSDAGGSWTDYSTGLPTGGPTSGTSIIYHNGSNDGLYAAIGGSVYYRESGMPSWISYSTGLPKVDITELEIQSSSQKIRAATYGRGAWESPLYITVGMDEMNTDINLNVYPNPTNEEVTITINGKKSISKTELTIYNLVGEKIYSENLTAIVTKLNTEPFSAGIYFVRVRDGEKVYTQKLVVE
jgi:photosystem II stability/assembly factor-like uncharacterized protein